MHEFVFAFTMVRNGIHEEFFAHLALARSKYVFCPRTSFKSPGTNMEIKYNLMTFGLPMSAFSIDTNGKFDGTAHLRWMAAKRKAEALSQKAKQTNGDKEDRLVPLIVVPNRNDVLLGRGKVIQEHPGNLRYRHLIESNRDRYENSSKFEKTAVAEVIVRLIKEANGRFLKQGEDCTGWVEVDDSISRDKVAHAFRNRRKVKSSGKTKNGPGASILSTPATFNKRNQHPCTNHDTNSWFWGTAVIGSPLRVSAAKRPRW